MTTYPTQDIGNVTATSVYEDRGYPLYGKVMAGTLIGLLYFAILIGNALTITSFCMDRQLRTVANYYILNLAATDLLVGLVSVPFYGIFTLLDYHWPFGPAVCKVYCVIDFLACAESSLAIFLISYDRLEIVRRGAEYAKYSTKKRAAILIPVTWFFAFLLYGPAIIGWDMWRGYSTIPPNYCRVEFATNLAYVVITSIIEFFVPFIMVVSCNALLYWHIRKRARAFASSQSREDGEAVKRDRKVLKNLSTLVTVFLFCWMPYTIATIVISLCEQCVNVDLYEFFIWLLWGNASMNAILYAYSNERFRSNYKKIILRVCCRRSMNKVSSGNSSVSAATDTTAAK